MPADEQPQQQQPPVLTATEARSGFRGRHAVWILGISLGLIVVIYAVMVGRVQGTRLSASGGQTTIDQKTFNEAKGFSTPPSQPRQSESSPITSAPAGK